MTYKEAADIVVDRTSHERYLWLVSDDNPDEWSKNAYRQQVATMAESGTLSSVHQESARPTVAESAALLRQMKACHFRSVSPGCGCSGAFCSLKEDASGRRPAIVPHQDCFACLEQYPA